jgi:hypothetical protein
MRCFLIALLLCSEPTRAADLAIAERLYQSGDYTAAFQEFRSLAEQGNPDAQVRLSEMYSRGRGTAQDQLESARWQWEAARNGRGDAAQAVGWPIQYSNLPSLECVCNIPPANPGPTGKPSPGITIEVTLHNTRPFIEQMVVQAENYQPGFEPARPNLGIHIYRIEGAERTEVPARVAETGGRNHGPYGDEVRKTHLRGRGIFDETSFIYITFPPTDAQLERFFQDTVKKTAELDKSYVDRLDATTRGILRTVYAQYLNYALPSQVGKYEIVAEYHSRDERFWAGHLAASCPFDVKSGALLQK